MEYTVWLQNHESGGILAIAPAYPDCRSIAKTEEEAVEQIKEKIREFVQKTKIRQIDVDVNGKDYSDSGNNLVGVFEDDETFDDFQDEIKKYRNSLTTEE